MIKNGREFIKRARKESNLKLEIINPSEEARLAVIGSVGHLKPMTEQVLVVDIGGGSTELVWLDLTNVEAKNRKNSIHSGLLSKIFSKKRNHLRGIKSCNMAFYKQDCIDINGFNNEFEGWGREDSEFVVRLFNTGINRKSLRFNAIQYHLWHKEIDRTSLDFNNQLLQNSIKNKLKVCKKGINKYI